MTREFRIAIIPVAEPNFAPTAILDAAIFEMFVANNAGEAVCQYWEQVTGGYLVVKPTILPWVTAPRSFGASDIVTLSDGSMKILRSTQLGLYKQVVSGLAGMGNGGHGTYDGIVYLLFPACDSSINDANGNPIPFQFEGGNFQDAGDLRTAILPVGTATHTHTFFTHEVGHLFGFPDTQGIYRWTGNGWDPGYGDPLDIMSAQGWFYGDPTHAGTTVQNWPAMSDGRIATDNMGPAPSLAELHFWDANVLPPTAVHDIRVDDDQVPSFRLDAAYAGSGGKRLVIVRAGAPGQEPAGGLGRVYIEFRDKREWDWGLDKPGTLRARTSVVAHVVETAASGLPQPFYKGQIAVPFLVDTDLQIPGSPLTMRVTQSGDRFVTLKVLRSSVQGFKVDAEVEVEEVEFNPHIPAVHLTPCGDKLHFGKWKDKSVGHFTATAWGYGGPGSEVVSPQPPVAPGDTPPAVVASDLLLLWFVGNRQVPEQPSGMLRGCQAPEGTFDIDYKLNLATRKLTLRSRFGDRFSMTVRAELNDNVTGQTAQQSVSFDAEGWYMGYPPDDIGKLARCGALRASELLIDPETFKIPDGKGPRPNWQELVKVQVERLRREGLQDRAKIDEFAQIGELMGGMRQTE